MKMILFVALLVGVAVSASADTLASLTTGGNEYDGVAYGQSVTTPDGGPWDNLGFNFFNGQTGGAYASGDLYVLTQAYAGTPAALSSSTAGYLGFTSTTQSGIWEFSNVTLAPDTQYFFYMDSIVPVGTTIKIFDTGNVYPGGDAYGSGGAGTFGSGPVDMLFVLTGDQTSTTPEPGTLALAVGAAGFMAMFRRRRKVWTGQPVNKPLR